MPDLQFASAGPVGDDVRSGVPIRPNADCEAELVRLCGSPQPVPRSDQPVAVDKWVDGTVLDRVWRVE